MQEQLLTRTSVIPTIISHAGLIVYFYQQSSPVVNLCYYIRKEIMLIAEPGVTANLLCRVFILKCKWQLTVLT